MAGIPACIKSSLCCFFFPFPERKPFLSTCCCSHTHFLHIIPPSVFLEMHSAFNQQPLLLSTDAESLHLYSSIFNMNRGCGGCRRAPRNVFLWNHTIWGKQTNGPHDYHRPFHGRFGAIVCLHLICMLSTLWFSARIFVLDVGREFFCEMNDVCSSELFYTRAPQSSHYMVWDWGLVAAQISLTHANGRLNPLQKAAPSISWKHTCSRQVEAGWLPCSRATLRMSESTDLLVQF